MSKKQTIIESAVRINELERELRSAKVDLEFAHGDLDTHRQIVQNARSIDLENRDRMHTLNQRHNALRSVFRKLKNTGAVSLNEITATNLVTGGTEEEQRLLQILADLKEPPATAYFLTFYVYLTPHGSETRIEVPMIDIELTKAEFDELKKVGP